ncbi:MAG: hypothetical protein WC428_02870, partial [Candidatus Paceibacterota bacterium]
MEENLKLRMYFFVPYNISEIQKSIQAGHALGRYALKYGRKDPDHIVWNFLENHETWVILNGGTTNDERDFEGIVAGTMNQIGDALNENHIDFSYFHEPDLNHALTAICFIADERVFDRERYPEFVNYFIDNYRPSAPAEEIVKIRMLLFEQLKDIYSKHYKEWVRMIGGVKNEFLRDLLKDKRLA